MPKGLWMKRRWLIWIALIAAAPPAAAEAQPQPIDAPGSWVHEAARATFPAQVGELRRVNLFRYDEAATNVSASYALAGTDGRLHLTVYIYPSPTLPGATPEETCRREYEETSRFILNQHAGGERVEEGAAPTAEGVNGRRSVFRYSAGFDGRMQEVRSELALYCRVGGGWQVKYRATSAAAFDASGEIEAFIRTGPWPGRPAGAERIAAGAASGAGPAPTAAAR